MAISIGILFRARFYISLDKTRAALYIILSLYYLLYLHLDVYLRISNLNRIYYLQ